MEIQEDTFGGQRHNIRNTARRNRQEPKMRSVKDKEDVGEVEKPSGLCLNCLKRKSDGGRSDPYGGRR
jgi:hypothetical protein